MVSIDLTVLGFEFVGSAILGALIGFGAKRIAKLLAIIIGVQLVVVRYLESRGIVVIHWDRLTGGLVGAREGAGAYGGNWVETAVTTISVGAGFTSGFLLGYHRG